MTLGSDRPSAPEEAAGTLVSCGDRHDDTCEKFGWPVEKANRGMPLAHPCGSLEHSGSASIKVDNTMSGLAGSALQAGWIQGDVHIHHVTTVRQQKTAIACERLHVLTVEDEKHMQAQLVGALRSDSRVGQIGTANDAAEALRYSREALRRGTPVQAWFLDIAMPGMSGLELAVAGQCFADPPQLVFVSSCDAHAMDAFELQAVDYLVKPVGQQRLAETVSRLVGE